RDVRRAFGPGHRPVLGPDVGVGRNLHAGQHLRHRSPAHDDVGDRVEAARDGLLEQDLLQQAIPGGFNTIPDIVVRRATVSQMLASMEIPPNPNVRSEDRAVPGPEGAPDISVRIYRPVDATGTLPGIYFIHGGGMILGDVAGEDPVASAICEHVGAVVVSVEYRLAPENPYPAPVEDCDAGLSGWPPTPPNSASTRTGWPSTA